MDNIFPNSYLEVLMQDWAMIKINLTKYTFSVLILASSLLFGSFLLNDAAAETVPEWVRNTALWYGEGNISETEFLNAIKFLLENDLIVLDEEVVPGDLTASVLIPNGNYDIASTGFYLPLNLEITKGATVVWVNDDTVAHTIQSQDDEGNVIGFFNSDILKTGDIFEFKFEEEGSFNYFCTIHPWRVGVITVR
jgi:hypothetical protein